VTDKYNHFAFLLPDIYVCREIPLRPEIKMFFRFRSEMS